MSFHFFIFPTSPAGNNNLNMIENYMGGGLMVIKLPVQTHSCQKWYCRYYGDLFWDGNIWGAYPQYTR